MHKRIMPDLNSVMKGAPKWIGGIDLTPVNSSGERMKFAAQLNSGIVKAGNNTFYLFYDLDEELFVQVHD